MVCRMGLGRNGVLAVGAIRGREVQTATIKCFDALWQGLRLLKVRLQLTAVWRLLSSRTCQHLGIDCWPQLAAGVMR